MITMAGSKASERAHCCIVLCEYCDCSWKHRSWSSSRRQRARWDLECALKILGRFIFSNKAISHNLSQNKIVRPARNKSSKCESLCVAFYFKPPQRWSVLVIFLIAETKCLTQDNLMEGVFTLTYIWREYSPHWWENMVWWFEEWSE